ncbi:MAG TPA: hypothetical protein VI819_02195 [Patescibacteria group bacterium]|nr:hypothetical protein [Patescibacteria group bacterium]
MEENNKPEIIPNPKKIPKTLKPDNLFILKNFLRNNFKKIVIIMGVITLTLMGFYFYSYLKIYNSPEFILKNAFNNFLKHDIYSFKGTLKLDFVDPENVNSKFVDLEYMNIPTDIMTQEHSIDIAGVYEKSDDLRFSSTINWNKNTDKEVVLDVISFNGDLYWKITKFFDEGLVNKEFLKDYVKIDLNNVSEATGIDKLTDNLSQLLQPSNLLYAGSLPKDVIEGEQNYHYKISFKDTHQTGFDELKEFDIWIKQKNREISKIKGKTMAKAFGSDKKYIDFSFDINFLGYDMSELKIASPSSFIELP